jgi:hypothetical protein
MRGPEQSVYAYRQHRAQMTRILRAYEQHPNPTKTHRVITTLLRYIVKLTVLNDEETSGYESELGKLGDKLVISIDGR